MIAVNSNINQFTPDSPALPTVWGLDPVQLYLRYWAALGVQVVRQGERSQIVSHAELYLLTDRRPLVLFQLAEVLDVLNWIKPLVMFVRLRDPRFSGGRALDRFESPDADENDPGLCRVVLTPDIEVARLWQSAPDARTAWRRLRRFTPRHDRVTLSVAGRVFDSQRRNEIAMFARELVRSWKRPDAIVTRLDARGREAWLDKSAVIHRNVELVGPVWIGAGRQLHGVERIVGPQILWDDGHARPALEAIQWLEIEPAANKAAATDSITVDRSGGGGSLLRASSRMLRKLMRS